MEIFEVSPNEYADIIKTPYHAFNAAVFNDLNRNKCDEVFYFLFREGKYRLGFIAGSRGKNLFSPFSAPFGGYSFISGDIRLQYIEEAIRLIKTRAAEKKFSSISITLPPPLYEGNFIAKQVNCLWREGFEISSVDLNYFFSLKMFDENYMDRIWYNARKNLRISMNSGLQFAKCTTGDEKRLAYDVICKNRESQGYPLRMSWQQLSDTILIIQADFFLVCTDRQSPVASAIVFHISKSVVQVIYWGDMPGYSEFRPMNFISFRIFEYYKSSGMEVVDIGPSSEHSVPNYGLCEFKEGIGCQIDTKYTFIHKLM